MQVMLNSGETTLNFGGEAKENIILCVFYKNWTHSTHT